MANVNDSNIISRLLSIPECYQLDFFVRSAPAIQDDSTYWDVLGTLWKAQGSHQHQGVWSSLFTCLRRNKHKVMKSSERKAFAKLPKVITAYRAINDESEIETALCWTLSEDIAKRVFSQGGRRKVVSKQFTKDEVFAYFNRRKEQEILVTQGLI
ncbi:hypothetical protein ACFJ9Q_004486 [Vibrio parahaemolyticus]|uniref:hypothetical protein n=1 Tax=Vibrio parahaemolyticus TaxID=670 RepID=UPI000AF57C37|nr:hypothetical protein [Vibrio parahaemolyticus]